MAAQDREPLAIAQLLIDLEHGKDQVDSILNGDEGGGTGGDSNGTGIDGDREDASISDG